jgi:hypothetical protein
MSYTVSGLDPRDFDELFALSDDELRARNAMRVVVTEFPGFPDRLSLDDAHVGEEVILAHYTHQPAGTPFQASHAIYLKPGAARAVTHGELPPALTRRTLSLRAFDESGMLRDAALADGADATATIERLLAAEGVAYLHAHYAAPGCYAARIDRA